MNIWVQGYQHKAWKDPFQFWAKADMPTEHYTTVLIQY